MPKKKEPMRIIVGTMRYEVENLTLGEVVQLALEKGAPPDAALRVHDGYNGPEAVLEWHITQPLEEKVRNG